MTIPELEAENAKLREIALRTIQEIVAMLKATKQR
jgi:hypothetical protein